MVMGLVDRAENTDPMWLFSDWNVASVNKKHNLKLHFILINVSLHLKSHRCLMQGYRMDMVDWQKYLNNNEIPVEQRKGKLFEHSVLKELYFFSVGSN